MRGERPGSCLCGKSRRIRAAWGKGGSGASGYLTPAERTDRDLLLAINLMVSAEDSDTWVLEPFEKDQFFEMLPAQSLWGANTTC